MSDQPEHARHLMGEIDALRADRCTHRLPTDTDALIAQTQRALENTPRQWYLVRSVAWLHLAVAYQSGRLDRAYATLAAGRREDTAEAGVVRGRIGGMNCYVQWIAADLPAMLQMASRFAGGRPATIT